MKKFLLILLALIFPLSVNTQEKVVEDARGVAFHLSQAPQKVVVLGYSEFDTLRALGLESHIVVSPKTNVPKYLGQISDDIKDVVSLKEPNLDLIASLNQDLIIANSRTADLVGNWKRLRLSSYLQLIIRIIYNPLPKSTSI